MAELEWLPQFEPYFIRVGRVTVLWSALELSINEAIWQLANVGFQAGACVTSQIVITSARLRALASLVALRGGTPALLRAINQFDARIDKLSRRRNRYVHDTAFLDQGSDTLHRLEITAERKLTFEYKPADIEEMDNLIESIHDSINTFSELRFKIRVGLPSWPQTEYERSLKDRPVLRR